MRPPRLLTALLPVLLGASLSAGLAAARRLDCDRLAGGERPRLSRHGREAVQLQVLAERVSRELRRDLTTRELAAAFADRLERLARCPAARACFPVAVPRAEFEAQGLVLAAGDRRRLLPVADALVGHLAAESVRRLAAWCAPPGRGRTEAERLLWAAWVEGLLDRVGRPFTDYTYADELERIVRAAREPEAVAPALELLAASPTAYLRLRRFESDSGERLAEALKAAEAAGARALVIDLRGNAGGRLLTAPLEVLLPEGAVILRRRGLGEPELEVLRAPGPGSPLALAVIVDGSTGSMAELFAASLRGAGRAVLIGERTWGKGLGQRLHPVGGEGLLVLDAHEYLLPDAEESWTGRGLAPDREVRPCGEPPASLEGRSLEQIATGDPALSAALAGLRTTS